MGKSVGTVVIDLEARVAKLESDLGRAQRIADARAKSIVRSLGAIGTAAAGAFSVGAFAKWIKGAIDAADSISKASQKVAINTETLSAWYGVADKAGVSADDLNTSLVKLAKNADAAAGGDKNAQAAFSRIGVNIRDSNGALKDTATLFRDVTQAMSEYADTPGKVAEATDLFGKSGANMMAMLNGGTQALRDAEKQAEQFGGTVGAKFAKNAERFNDALSDMKQAGEGVATTIAGAMAPALADFAEKLRDYFKSEQWANTLTNIEKLTKMVVDNIGAITDAVKFLAEMWAISFAGKIAGSVAAFSLDLIKASKNMDALGNSTKATFAQSVKSIGLVNSAVGLLQAALIGWKVGTYLSEQFLIVRIAGTYMVEGLLITWEILKAAWKGLCDFFVRAWNGVITAINWGAQKMAGTMSWVLDKLGADDKAAAVREWGKAFEINTDALKGQADDAATNLQQFSNKVIAIHKDLNDQRDALRQEDAAKDKQAADVRTMGLDALHGSTEDLMPKTKTLPDRIAQDAKKAKDALEGLNKALEEVYAKNLESGDQMQDQRADMIKRLAEAGAEAIKDGAKVTTVQDKIKEGIVQIDQYLAKQQDSSKKALDEYRRNMEAKLRTDQEDLDLRVASIGLSDREIDLARQKLEIQRDANAERERLQSQLIEKKITPADYAEAMQAVQEYEDKRVQASVDANDRILAAQKDWTEGARRAYQNFIDNADNIAGQVETIFSNAFNNLADLIGTFVTTGKASFKDFVVSVLSDFAKMEARIAMSNVMKALQSGSEGGTSWWSKLVGAFTQNANGNVYASGSLHRFANTVQTTPQHFAFAQGGFGTFAEAGPEAIMPLSKTSDGKLGVKASGGQAVTNVYTTINVDNSGGATSSTTTDNDNVRNQAAALDARIRAVIGQEQRPGGSLWRMQHG